MFLPLIMFLPSCLYYSLNKYATNETTTQINYKYQSNEVNSINDVIERNIYHLNINNTTLDNYFLFNEDLELDFDILATYNYNFTNYNLNSDADETLGAEFGNTLVNFSVYYDSAKINLYLNSSNVFQYCEIGNLTEEDFTLNCIIRINTINNLSNYLCFEYTDYNVIESVETNVQDTISNKMYLAWESIWNLPLFAWTKNSFVSAPFTYITGLFGLSATNSLNYVFTYFCSISICWLVFDLLMYVPNLAHKWIDKGAIE